MRTGVPALESWRSCHPAALMSSRCRRAADQRRPFREKLVEDLACLSDGRRDSRPAIPTPPAKRSRSGTLGLRAVAVIPAPYLGNSLMTRQNRCAAHHGLGSMPRQKSGKTRARILGGTPGPSGFNHTAGRLLGIDCDFVTAALGNCDGGAFPNPADLSDTSEAPY